MSINYYLFLNGMSTSVIKNSFSISPIINIDFEENMIHLLLSNGSVISTSLDQFKKLKKASPSQRKNWRLIGDGIGIHFEDIDEDISVEALLH